MGSVEVDVYIAALTPDTNSTNIQNLERLFSNDIFTVKVRYIPPPPNLTPSPTMTPNDQLMAYRFIKILEEAQTVEPGKYLVFIWENSVSVSTPDGVDQIIDYAVINNGGLSPIPTNDSWEILYLTRWQDLCDQYQVDTTQNVTDTSVILTNDNSTFGFQAYLISPCGRDMLLGLMPMLNGQLFPPIIYPLDTQIQLAVQVDGLRRWVTVPNLFEYDVTWDLDVYEDNVFKTQTCRFDAQTADEPTNFVPLLIGLAIILLIIVVAWSAVKIGPDDSQYDRPK